VGEEEIMAIDFTKVVPISKMKGDDEVDTKLLKEMLKEASDYIMGFSWHKGVKEVYFGMGVGGVAAVFLFKIQPSNKSVDEWVWVIVGDIPSAYINIDESPNPACALDGYIGAMEEWIKAVKSGKSVEKLIPVNAPATIENAKDLEKRLKFIDKEILSYYSEDLKN